MRDSDLPVTTSNICSVVALGADDRSISVWQTKCPRPLIVAKSVFERSIMDLAWYFFHRFICQCTHFHYNLYRSWDGCCLYAVSLDGTLCALQFSKDELEGILPFSAQEQYLRKFPFTPPPLPSGYVHPPGLAEAVAGHHAPLAAQSQQSQRSASQGGEVVNKLIAKRKDKNKKRVTLAPAPSTSTPAAAIPKSSQSVPTPVSNGLGGSTAGTTKAAGTASSNFRRASSGGGQVTSDGFGFGFNSSDVEMGDAGFEADVPIVALATSSPTGARRQSDDTKAPKARTLGGDRQREVGPVRELAAGGSTGSGLTGTLSHTALPVSPLVTYLSIKSGQGSTEFTFEANNPEDNGTPA
jgi:protein HIRA/HIR1